VRVLCSILMELALCENVVAFSLDVRSCRLQSVEVRYVAVGEAEHYDCACAGREISALSASLQVPRRHRLLFYVKSSLPLVASAMAMVSAMASAAAACFRLYIFQMDS